MKRYAHWLQPAKRSVYPQAIVCVEVEVSYHESSPPMTTQAATLRSWMAHTATRSGSDYVKAKDYNGNSAERFWELLAGLARKHSPVWVFTSRAPRAWSALDIWGAIERGVFSHDGIDTLAAPGKPQNKRAPSHGYLVLDDPVNAVQLRPVAFPGKVVMVDLRNYGIHLDLEKLHATDRLVRSFQFVTGMLAALDAGELGSLQITVSSQAMTTLRRRFLTHALYAHNHPQALLLENEAYHGGRCEAYRIGVVKGPLYFTDFTSLYGAMGAEHSVPVQLRWYQEFTPPCEGHSLRDDPPDFADCLIETPSPYYPFARNNLVVYPVGEFRTTLCGPELASALLAGHVQRVYRAAWYHKRPALEAFCKYFLAKRVQLKSDGMSDLETWVKRLLVGLVGKLGQRGTSWEDVPDKTWLEPWDSWIADWREQKNVRWRAIAGRVQRQEKALWSPDAIPSAAAFITSAARNRLLTAILTARWENVFYCDTDSLLTNRDGYDRLCKAGIVKLGEAGYLRLEEQCSSAEIRGWKSYTAGSKEANSGIPRGTLDTASSLFYRWLTLWIADSVKTHAAPTGQRKLIRAHANRIYRHGVISKTGAVRPFLLPKELGRIKGE